jgi:hypothetical protein
MPRSGTPGPRLHHLPLPRHHARRGAGASAPGRSGAGCPDRGGPSTIRQFLAADLIDYLHIVVVPIVLGRGERLWDGLEALEERFHAEAVSSPSGITHLTFTRR